MLKRYFIRTEIEIKNVSIHFGNMIERMDIRAELHPMGKKHPGRPNDVTINVPLGWEILDVIKTILHEQVGKVLEKDNPKGE